MNMPATLTKGTFRSGIYNAICGTRFFAHLTLWRIYMFPCKRRIFWYLLRIIPALVFTQICGHSKMAWKSSFVITTGHAYMRDGGVTCKYRIPDEYSGFVVLERILWRHKRSPVSPSSVINTLIYNAIEPKYVFFLLLWSSTSQGHLHVWYKLCRTSTLICLYVGNYFILSTFCLITASKWH